jgi:hypothetical protein
LLPPLAGIEMHFLIAGFKVFFTKEALVKYLDLKKE